METAQSKIGDTAAQAGKAFTFDPLTVDDAFSKILSAASSKGINPVQHSERKAARKSSKTKPKPAKKKPVKK